MTFGLRISTSIYVYMYIEWVPVFPIYYSGGCAKEPYCNAAWRPELSLAKIKCTLY